MANAPGYGLHSTDIVDYRKEYKKMTKDLAQYNQNAEVLGYSGLVNRTSKEKIEFYLNNTEFIISGEGNQANWQKTKKYNRILPMDEYEVGAAWTDKMIDDASAKEIHAWKEEVLRADQRLLAKLYFSAAVGGDAAGNYKGFWSGSTTEWNGTTLTGNNTKAPKWKNNTFATSHNHYAVTGSTSVALEDFTTMKQDITEHGYGLNGRLLCFVSQNTAKAIEDLAGWTTAMTSNNVVNKISELGLQSKVSMLNGFTIVIDDWIPDSYLYAQATDDPTGVMAMREPIHGGGLKYYKGPFEDYPIKESYYKRRAGMAIKNRGSGVVYYLHGSSYSTANANYTFTQ